MTGSGGGVGGFGGGGGSGVASGGSGLLSLLPASTDAAAFAAVAGAAFFEVLALAVAAGFLAAGFLAGALAVAFPKPDDMCAPFRALHATRLPASGGDSASSHNTIPTTQCRNVYRNVSSDRKRCRCAWPGLYREGKESQGR